MVGSRIATLCLFSIATCALTVGCQTQRGRTSVVSQTNPRVETTPVWSDPQSPGPPAQDSDPFASIIQPTGNEPKPFPDRPHDPPAHLSSTRLASFETPARPVSQDSKVDQVAQVDRRINALKALLGQAGVNGAAPLPPGPPRQPPIAVRVPKPNGANKVHVVSSNERISLVVRDAPLSIVLGMIAEQQGLNIVTGSGVTGNISVTLTNASLDDAFNAILSANGYAWVKQKNIIIVSKIGKDNDVPPELQARAMQVFELNFIDSSDVQKVATLLLSPAGKVTVTQSDPTDRKKTRDRVIVEDFPSNLKRVANYLAQVDRAPRQVMVEAHILQVELGDDTAHGVDFAALARVANGATIASSPAFNTPTAALNAIASPSYNVSVVGTDLLAVIDALKRTTDAKTLASPKLMVVNGQQARIQIGAQLGFRVVTTTQTSTLEEIKFLDVGIVLKVTPQITDDNQVLLTVKPEVSTGEINPDTGLPQEQTTELETTILCACVRIVGSRIQAGFQ